jgi:hypothetical protein
VRRHCDGTDPYLIGEDDQPGCACGLVFDDIDRWVIWPHLRVPSPEEKRAALESAMWQADQLIRAAGGYDDPLASPTSVIRLTGRSPVDASTDDAG